MLVHPLALLLPAERTLSGSLQVNHHSQNALSACTYPNPKSGTYLLMLCWLAETQNTPWCAPEEQAENVGYVQSADVCIGLLQGSAPPIAVEPRAPFLFRSATEHRVACTRRCQGMRQKCFAQN